MAKMSKCCQCGCSTNHPIEFKRKKYCEVCFEKNFDADTVSRHYCYLTFQSICGRKPSDMEWTQLNRLVAKNTESSTNWTWAKVEYALQYVYEIERVEVSEEYGVIGILPYYESKMMKFRNECFDVLDDVEEFGFGMEEEEMIILKPKKNYGKVELKSIDSIINWNEEDDEEWQDE